MHEESSSSPTPNSGAAASGGDPQGASEHPSAQPPAEGGLSPSATTSPAGTGVTTSADDLPQIEPPTAGFIVQLFLIPMLIVSLVVVVVLAFNWIAHMGSDPLKLVADLERLDSGSWQSATTLAQVLSDNRYADLRSNPELASRVSNLLIDQLEAVDQQIKDGEIDPNRTRLRYYLCHVLSTLEITDGVPALVQAATTERDPSEITVRQAAIASLAKLGSNRLIDKEELRSMPGVIDALLEASRERSEHEQLLRKTVADLQRNSGQSEETVIEQYDRAQATVTLRSSAVVALGVLGGEQAIDQLLVMLGDAHCDIRFDAAIGLARQGEAGAAPVLLEMLDPENEESIVYTPQESSQGYKRALVLVNAIRATQLLLEANNQIEEAPFRIAAERLVSYRKSKEVNNEARLLLQFLGE